MKKIIALLLVVLSVFSVTPVTVLASGSNNDAEYGEVSLGEIQEMFVAHLDNAGLSLEPGTMAYYEYIVEQLFERTDDILRSNENYDLLHAYMADKTTGTPYHSIIINAKDSATAYFCGHSSNRSNEDVNDFLDESSDKFILFDLT